MMVNYNQIGLDDTIAAIATPSGIGALGIIKVSGKEAIEWVNRFFSSKDLVEEKSHTLHYGSIIHNGHIIDEVVVSLFRSPKSYTGEDSVEISCHGSPYILQKIMEILIGVGVRTANPGEFTLRAFLNGKLDLSQAEAVADLIAANSSSSHELAMKQMRGGYSKKMQQLRERLVSFASLIELELDFSEEDVEFANRDDLVILIREIEKAVHDLIVSFQLGNVLKNGVTTVIAGRPNAGKSTLLNALLQEERAIVSDIPGTTRDTIEEIINIDGILFRLIDTAGIRDAVGKIEEIGVTRTFEKIRQSAIVIYVFDVNELDAGQLEGDLNKLNTSVPIIAVGNKSDLIDENALTEKFNSNSDIVFVSSKNEGNLEGIRTELLENFTKHDWHRENIIVSNMRHYEALKKADEAMKHVLEGVESHTSGELLALDIRDALDALGEITGEITNEDLLGNIFSNFCIGK